jgi:N4-gp56 family major capsid protein
MENNTTNQSDLVKVARDQAFMLGFTPTMIFAQVAQSKEWDQQGDPQKGASVEFVVFNQLTPSRATLDEVNDPDGKTLGKTVKTVTLLEKGDVVTTTKKLRLTSLHNLDLATLQIVGQQAGESTDLYARSIMDSQVGGKYVTYVGQTAKNAIVAANKMVAAEVHKAFNKLQRANVPVDPRFGSYVAIAHPDVIHDLKTETGEQSWTMISKYDETQRANLLRGEIGMFGGFRWISSTNTALEYGAGGDDTISSLEGAHAAGDTTIAVPTGEGAGFAAGDIIVITTGGNNYAYEVTDVTGDVLTIDKCISVNGFVERQEDGSGLLVAGVNNDVLKIAASVYTTYFVGFQAFGYGYAESPNLKITGPFDKLGRLMNVGWYALHGFGELRPEACHKVFSASSLGFNG